MRESHADATFLNVENTEDEASKWELIVRGACDRPEDDGIHPESLGWRQKAHPEIP